MLKKFTAALAVFALFSLFACSSDDEPDERKRVESNSSSSLEDGGNSSSDGEVETSSSSSEPRDSIEIDITYLNGTPSIFGTHPFSYTQRNGTDEDLRPFWKCASDSLSQSTGCSNTELMATDVATTGSILQNTLTTLNAPLRYKIDGNRAVGSYSISAIVLKEYRLPAAGSQAALGLNVYDPDKEPVLSIGDKAPTAIDNAEALSYRHSGGAHEFRAVINENAWWFVKTPKAPEDNTIIIIPFEEFLSAGTLATEDEEGTPFDLSQVTQFLWVVPYDSENPENNIGTLNISEFKAIWWF